jgi:hypothetical protein
MKNFSLWLLLFFSVLLWGTFASAIPLDLTGFTADPSVSESGGRVDFNENIDYAAIYFFNDNFFIGADDTILSFDFDFLLGPGDFDDYLTFELNFGSEFDVDINTTGGHFEIDVSPFQEDTVSLAWGLIWNGDSDAGTTASIYNIDMASAAAPVPEPATLILMGSGLVALVGVRRKKLLKKT